MKPLLLVVLLLLLPATAWAPLQPHYWETPVNHPRAYVEAKARQYGVPVPLALAVWQMECSRKIYRPDGKAKERGCWQVTRDAAKDVFCPWQHARFFRISTVCGMRYLAESLRVCKGSKTQAANRYNTGRCLKRGKIWGYAQAIARLMMKYQPTT